MQHQEVLKSKFAIQEQEDPSREVSIYSLGAMALHGLSPLCSSPSSAEEGAETGLRVSHCQKLCGLAMFSFLCRGISSAPLCSLPPPQNHGILRAGKDP